MLTAFRHKVLVSHWFHNKHFRSEDFLSENSALYLTNTIRFFAVSLIGIFLPIYIYELSSSSVIFNDDLVINGICWILGYYLTRSASTILFLNTISQYVFTKLSFRWSIFLSFFVLAGEICLWLLGSINPLFILLSGVFAGLSINLYWVPYHISFIRKMGSKTNNYGKTTSHRFFYVKLTSGLAPFIGGLIINFFGFTVLFVLSIILVLIAGLPVLFMSTETKHSKHQPIPIIKKFLINHKKYNLTTYIVGVGLEDVIYTLFWPILLFIVLESFTKIGLINTISLTLSSFTVIWTGRLIDKYGTKLPHKIGVTINSLLYVPRIFLNIPIAMYSIDIIDRINGSFNALPRLSKFYEVAKKSDLNESDFIIYREFLIHFTQMILCSLLLIAFAFISQWRWVFIIAFIGSVMSYLVEIEDEN